MSTLAAFLYTRRLVEDDESFFVNSLDLASRVNECLEFLYEKLNSEVTDTSTEEEIQYWYYEAGKIHFADNLRLWFRIIYSILLGEESGGRFGVVTRVLGVERILEMIYNVREDNTLSHWGWAKEY